MEFFHSLTSLSASHLSAKLKKQIHYVQAVLQIVNLVLTWNKSEKKSDLSYPYLYIVGNGNAIRVYIVKSNSIVSFLFPLGVSVKSDSCGNENWIINKHDVVLNYSIVSRCLEYANSLGLKKNASKIIDIAKNIEHDDTVSRYSFDLLEFLLMTEPCYIRFDNDPKSACKYLHPKKHFDVNFSVNGSYKIGAFTELDVEDVKDVLDKTTNSWYVRRQKISATNTATNKKYRSKKKRRLNRMRKCRRMRDRLRSFHRG